MADMLGCGPAPVPDDVDREQKTTKGVHEPPFSKEPD
jgi:hypothetical protein